MQKDYNREYAGGQIMHLDPVSVDHYLLCTNHCSRVNHMNQCDDILNTMSKIISFEG